MLGACLISRDQAAYSPAKAKFSKPSPMVPPLLSLQEFLGDPNGPLAHELLHTNYTDRSRTTLPAGAAWHHTEATPVSAPQRQDQGGGDGRQH